MNTVRRFTTAVAFAAMFAVGMTFSTATLEAKARGGGDPKTAICAYLQKVIEYPYTSPFIRELALRAWNDMGCGG
jgi:hypothetical protein